MRSLISTFLVFTAMIIFIGCGGQDANNVNGETKKVNVENHDGHNHDGHDHGSHEGHNHDHSGHDHGSADKSGPEYTSAYICPMHCKGSGSAEAGKCPVCEMALVENKEK